MPWCGHPADTPQVPPQRGRGLRQLPQICTRVHMPMRSQVCTCTHTQSKAPHPSTGTPHAPAHPSTVGSTHCPRERVVAGGREPSAWCQACWPLQTPGDAGQGCQPHTGHPMAGRETGAVPSRDRWGCWGMQGSRGAVGARGHPGVWGQGTVTGLGEEQHAGVEWPHENTCHAGRDAQAVAKTGIPPPNDVPGTPHVGLGGPLGVPPPARTRGAGRPSCRHLVPC